MCQKLIWMLGNTAETRQRVSWTSWSLHLTNTNKQVIDMKKKLKLGHETEGGWNGGYLDWG